MNNSELTLRVKKDIRNGMDDLFYKLDDLEKSEIEPYHQELLKQARRVEKFLNLKPTFS